MIFTYKERDGKTYTVDYRYGGDITIAPASGKALVTETLRERKARSQFQPGLEAYVTWLVSTLPDGKIIDATPIPPPCTVPKGAVS